LSTDGLALIPYAFEGFRLIARRPVSFLAWCAVMAVTVGLTFVGARAFPSPYAFPAHSLSERAVQLQLHVFEIVLLNFVLMFIGMSFVACAVYRAVLKPEQGRFGYLRAGWDELRVMGLSAIVSGAAVALAAALIALGAVVTTALHDGPGLNYLWLAVGIDAVLFVPIALVGARLSLAAPVAMIERRRAFAVSWALTFKPFWRLLAMWAVATVVALLFDLLMQALFGLLGRSNLLSTMGVRLEPVVPRGVAEVLGFVGSVLLQCVQAVLWAAPAAAVYARLSPPKTAVAETFD
jgi:hypothetical protein